MVAYARKNILFNEGGHSFKIRRDDVVTVPEWVAKSDYFAALVKDGKIVVTETVKEVDKAVQKAEVKAEKETKKKGKK